MNEMAQVFELMKAANIPEIVVARHILGVSRAAMYQWADGGVPPNRVNQLTALRDTLAYHIEKGNLPKKYDELLWQGILRVTEDS